MNKKVLAPKQDNTLQDFFKDLSNHFSQSNSKGLSINADVAKQFINSFAEMLAKLASEEKSVTFRGFLKVSGKLKEAGESTNPKNGEKVKVEEKMYPKFSITKGFKEKVQNMYKTK
ncbi:MAG: HU family DNA-binding protein [Alphaproteobacteria bacterium]|nr:MAG: HU family DNA-binding protein [Alphaproteobacteria bacterium]